MKFPPPRQDGARNSPPSLEGTVKKLSLNVEELSVTSFEISTAQETRGTVQGHEDATRYCSVSCGDPLSAIYIYFMKLATE